MLVFKIKIYLGIIFLTIFQTQTILGMEDQQLGFVEQLRERNRMLEERNTLLEERNTLLEQQQLLLQRPVSNLPKNNLSREIDKISSKTSTISLVTGCSIQFIGWWFNSKDIQHVGKLIRHGGQVLSGVMTTGSGVVETFEKSDPKYLIKSASGIVITTNAALNLRNDFIEKDISDICKKQHICCKENKIQNDLQSDQPEQKIISIEQNEIQNLVDKTEDKDKDKDEFEVDTQRLTYLTEKQNENKTLINVVNYVSNGLSVFNAASSMYDEYYMQN